MVISALSSRKGCAAWSGQTTTWCIDGRCPSPNFLAVRVVSFTNEVFLGRLGAFRLSSFKCFLVGDLSCFHRVCDAEVARRLNESLHDNVNTSVVGERIRNAWLRTRVNIDPAWHGMGGRLSPCASTGKGVYKGGLALWRGGMYV
jgi:hypothetical protein